MLQHGQGMFCCICPTCGWIVVHVLLCKYHGGSQLQQVWGLACLRGLCNTAGACHIVPLATARCDQVGLPGWTLNLGMNMQYCARLGPALPGWPEWKLQHGQGM